MHLQSILSAKKKKSVYTYQRSFQYEMKTIQTMLVAKQYIGQAHTLHYQIGNLNLFVIKYGGGKHFPDALCSSAKICYVSKRKLIQESRILSASFVSNSTFYNIAFLASVPPRKLRLTFSYAAYPLHSLFGPRPKSIFMYVNRNVDNNDNK